MLHFISGPIKLFLTTFVGALQHTFIFHCEGLMVILFFFVVKLAGTVLAPDEEVVVVLEHVVITACCRLEG